MNSLSIDGVEKGDNNGSGQLRDPLVAVEEGTHGTEERCCRICLEDDDVGDMIAPCRCKGSSKWVHRHCLDEWRTVNKDDLAFSRCGECLLDYHLESVHQGENSNRRCKYCLFVSWDMCSIFLFLQVLIATVGALVWVIFFPMGLYHEIADNIFNATATCDTAVCQIAFSYLGGLSSLLLILGIYGLVVLCGNSCHMSNSINAMSEHVFRENRGDSYETGHAASHSAAAPVMDRGAREGYEDDHVEPPYRHQQRSRYPRRGRRRRGDSGCCGDPYCGGYYYHYPFYGGDGCRCYCPDSSCNDGHCCPDVGIGGGSGSGGGGSGSGNNEGDGAHILLLILAIVGIILCTIGLIVGSIIVCVAIQRILLRHLWILQKQRLVQEFQVKDLSQCHAKANKNASTFVIPPGTAPPDLPPPSAPSSLLDSDKDHLKKLGLME